MVDNFYSAVSLYAKTLVRSGWMSHYDKTKVVDKDEWTPFRPRPVFFGYRDVDEGV